MYKLLLCLRYLRTRYIALACIISVMLGVATMIVVNSVMAGFGTEMRDRIHGILADVILETRSMQGVPDAEAKMARVREVAGRYIDAMTATVEIYGMMTFSFAGDSFTVPTTLIGIDPRGKAMVGPLTQYLESYQPAAPGRRNTASTPRSKDEPPGWELTPAALSYRRRMKERSRLFLREEGFDVSDATAESGDEPASAPPFHDAPNFKGPVTAGGTLDNTADPFDAPDPFDEEPRRSREVDDGPLPARLYVGHGLISFPFREPETGRMETKLMVRPGDDVIISTVTAARPPDVCKFNATVVDIFKSGMSEYDSNLVFMNLAQLQDYRGMYSQDANGRVRSITSIQIKLKNYDHAPKVVAMLQAAFPPGQFHVRTWEDKQGPLLEAISVESAILNVLLFLIIAVAGFGILAIFFMIVVEKTRDIGILKALGASAGGVMSIFVSYGLALGLVGSGVGVATGLLFVHYINEIEDVLSWLTGHKVFDEQIYYFLEIPTRVNPLMVVWVACGAIAIAVLASVLPARRAARLHPVEALRYE